MKTDAMLSMLRSAGARGVTRGELFDTLKVANPSYLVERLAAQGHSITETTEELNGGITSRFTLMVDGADQRPMFEGDAGDTLGTWQEEPVGFDEFRAREAARR